MPTSANVQIQSIVWDYDLIGGSTVVTGYQPVPTGNADLINTTRQIGKNILTAANSVWVVFELNTGGTDVDAHVLEFYDTGFSNSQPLVVMGSNSSSGTSRIFKLWDDVSNTYIVAATANTPITAVDNVRHDVNVAISGDNISFAVYMNKELAANNGELSATFDMTSANVTVNSSSTFDLIRFGNYDVTPSSDQTLEYSLICDLDSRDYTFYKNDLTAGSLAQWNTNDLTSVEDSVNNATYIRSLDGNQKWSANLVTTIPEDYYTIGKVKMSWRGKTGVNGGPTGIRAFVSNGATIIDNSNTVLMAEGGFAQYTWETSINPTTNTTWVASDLADYDIGLETID